MKILSDMLKRIALLELFSHRWYKCSRPLSICSDALEVKGISGTKCFVMVLQETYVHELVAEVPRR